MTFITVIVLAFNRKKVDQHAVNEKSYKNNNSVLSSKIIIFSKKNAISPCNKYMVTTV